jgi:hypothetical protein
MRILRDGALLSVVVSAYLLVVLRFNPRIALRHYPKEIQEIVPPKSRKERRMSILFGLLIGAPFTAGLLWRTAALESNSFRELFAYVFGVLFIFNVVDLLILDWLILCWFEPRWAILPGTENVVLPKQYLHHFKGFLIGTVGLLIVALAVAAYESSPLRPGSQAADMIIQRTRTRSERGVGYVADQAQRIK